MSWFDDKAKRGYVGSWAYIILVFVVIGFFSINEVPASNKDLITAIVGMLVSSLGVVVFTLIGKDPEELEQIKSEKEILIEQNKSMSIRINHLESMFMDLQTQVIDKLSIIANKK